TLREAIYEAEFKNAADEVTKDSSFLLQQVRTQGGATVDFTYPKKGWVIELMRDGDNMEGHSMLFDPNTGRYNQWKNCNWQVVDFCFHTMPVKQCNSNKYRTVTITMEDSADPQFMEATISGKDMNKKKVFLFQP
ncbi:hypothetical protein BT96DRAFT_951804, partial [Gymnopus androsaceus JB14]